MALNRHTLKGLFLMSCLIGMGMITFLRGRDLFQQFGFSIGLGAVLIIAGSSVIFVAIAIRQTLAVSGKRSQAIDRQLDEADLDMPQ